MKLFVALISLFLICVPVDTAHAQLTVTPVTNLSFGTFVIRDFSSTALISVAADGTNTTNANVIVLTPGQRAQYSVTGGPVTSSFTVTIDSNTNATRTAGGVSGTFVMDTFNVFPVSLSTDGAGAGSFFVGARANTSGGGTAYLDGSYDATYDLTVQF